MCPLAQREEALLSRYLGVTLRFFHLPLRQPGRYTRRNSPIEVLKMSKSRWMGLATAFLFVAASAQLARAQKLDATVLYRQASDSNYFAVIPGYTVTPDEGGIDCSLEPLSEACAAPSRNNGAIAAPGQVSYNLVGTTLSLLLPDGRVALVNCVNKYSVKGNYLSQRICDMPLVEHVEAELNGKNARLKWPVGNEGKTVNETYRVVAILNKPLIASR